MAQSFLKTIRESINYWWLILLSGVLLIIVGIWVISSPIASYLSLSILFAWGILLTGIFEIIFAVSNRKGMDSWGWTLASGVIDLVIGFYLLSYPALTMTVLPFILGFWLLYRGGSAIGAAFDMKSYGDKNWGWFLFLGIAIIFFGLMVLINPVWRIEHHHLDRLCVYLFRGIQNLPVN